MVLSQSNVTGSGPFRAEIHLLGRAILQGRHDGLSLQQRQRDIAILRHGLLLLYEVARRPFLRAYGRDSEEGDGEDEEDRKSSQDEEPRRRSVSQHHGCEVYAVAWYALSLFVVYQQRSAGGAAGIERRSQARYSIRCEEDREQRVQGGKKKDELPTCPPLCSPANKSERRVRVVRCLSSLLLLCFVFVFVFVFFFFFVFVVARSGGKGSCLVMLIVVVLFSPFSAWGVFFLPSSRASGWKMTARKTLVKPMQNSLSVAGQGCQLLSALSRR
ncbi:hypothetical protein TRV_05867 [Trichophyton verrucosum HKI 0517]|uniref:Transmembrane protein n=1 Tax=Trichophyton verrucosum (strain HKI 0517) TaxID=663202 RepID=D4DFC1_TRIVH|nr:uncharacterized protein TRV_05867 [Trichophyton verrucosum HKI 0517]EFE39470.1 hypothetical protein TRV_05867 [Trichophyton verrucosum HKI 0517]